MHSISVRLSAGSERTKRIGYNAVFLKLLQYKNLLHAIILIYVSTPKYTTLK